MFFMMLIRERANFIIIGANLIRGVIKMGLVIPMVLIVVVVVIVWMMIILNTQLIHHTISYHFLDGSF